MKKNDIFKGFPDYIKKYLELIPKRRKIGRNEKYPYGSGKKFKLCCFGKKWSEIDLIFCNRVKKHIINDIDTKYPNNSFIIFDLDEPTQCVSFNYGEYLNKEWALYFYRNNIEIRDKEFIEISNKVLKYIESINQIIFRNNIILDLDTNKVKEIEILFLAFKKEFIINTLKTYKNFIPGLDFIQYILIQRIGQELYEYLMNMGYTSLYPREITSK